ncbi:MAG: hypothetical protein HC879_06500 [Leptolyngbyaceae cyanobacterium SL_5_9]|nr:hypothetical protein [Leptolyngbyaceae cyanobacterium SL_5_9]NJO76760.1 hypothetical protein [Leptolyngbyaceae cyanobacterium RM1_406_9]
MHPDSIASQVLILGFLFVGMATGIDVFYAALATSAGHFLRRRKRFVKGQRYVESSIYVGLGIATALSGSKG